MPKLKQYSEQESKQITNALTSYEHAVRESDEFSAETIYTWVLSFEKLQLPVDEVISLIEKTVFKKKFGKTKFDDFLNEDHTYIDYHESSKVAIRMFNGMLTSVGLDPNKIEMKQLEKLRLEMEEATKQLLDIPQEKRITTQIQNYKEK